MRPEDWTPEQVRAAIDEILAPLDPFERTVIEAVLSDIALKDVPAWLGIDQATFDDVFASARMKLRPRRSPQDGHRKAAAADSDREDS
jgi:FixJ family two-component response regulator